MEIKPTYVTFEQAKWLKEIGFKESTNHYYFEDGEFREHSLTGTNGYYGEPYEFSLQEFLEDWNNNWLTRKNGDRCFGCNKNRGYFETFAAPELHQVVEWLESKNIFVVVTPEFYTNGINWNWQIFEYSPTDIDCVTDRSTGMYGDNGEYQTKAEAYQAAFDYIINNNLI